MASFQKKRDVLQVPVGWNIYFFPIPCYTFVVFYGLQPKRYFDVIGVPIFCIMFIFKINVKEKGKVNDNTAKMQSTNQLGV